MFANFFYSVCSNGVVPSYRLRDFQMILEVNSFKNYIYVENEVVYLKYINRLVFSRNMWMSCLEFTIAI